MKLVFMGTPDFAAEALEALLGAGYEVTAVVTQPDRPKGRSGQLQPSPVKKCALRHGIEVFQPEKLKAPEAVAQLKTYPADIYIVAAFGQILSQEILGIPEYGCLNIHASLLPKYRGSSPIQRAILGGEAESGVTIMQMDAGVDTGDIRYVRKTPLDARETFETLHDKLAKLGGEAIVEALALLQEGKLTRTPQNDAENSRAPLIHKEDGEIDFSATSAEVDAKIRAMNPWPGAYTYLGNGSERKMLKIWAAEPEGPLDAARKGSPSGGAGGALPGEEDPAPGTVAGIAKDSFLVRTGDGVIRVHEVQLEGKKRMDAGAFLLGGKLAAGQRLG